MVCCSSVLSRVLSRTPINDVYTHHTDGAFLLLLLLSPPPPPLSPLPPPSSDARNPYKDFSWIWVPYCTGDVHVGQVEKRFEGKMRHFVGRNNLDLMMARATASFPTVDTLVVSGESAGGFGAVTNYDFYRSFYPGENTRGVLVDDSGPVLDDTALAPCLQEGWRR